MYFLTISSYWKNNQLNRPNITRVMLNRLVALPPRLFSVALSWFLLVGLTLGDGVFSPQNLNNMYFSTMSRCRKNDQLNISNITQAMSKKVIALASMLRFDLCFLLMMALIKHTNSLKYSS